VNRIRKGRGPAIHSLNPHVPLVELIDPFRQIWKTGIKDIDILTPSGNVVGKGGRYSVAASGERTVPDQWEMNPQHGASPSKGLSLFSGGSEKEVEREKIFIAAMTKRELPGQTRDGPFGPDESKPPAAHVSRVGHAALTNGEYLS